MEQMECVFLAKLHYFADVFFLYMRCIQVFGKYRMFDLVFFVG